MTAEQIEQERIAFESNREIQRATGDFDCEKDGYGHYTDSHTAAAWVSWLAAKEHATH